jgi:dephospho-CoA kinase
MLKLKKIAITGGIATGKSTICDFLKEFGAYVIKADEIVHDILKLNTKVKKQVVKLLGKQVINNNQLDRREIAKIVFNDKTILKSFEKIIHPIVLNDIKTKISNINDKYSCVFVEIPLLFELFQEGYFDFIILVTTKEVICDKRLTKKRILKEEYNLRMENQLSTKIKAQKANFIIENNSNLDDLKEKTYNLYQSLLAA